ncbi:MAG: hypothetical protein ACJA0X_001566 [Cyclobacteriaceae bacterium]|jgi:hypothetical protein
MSSIITQFFQYPLGQKRGPNIVKSPIVTVPQKVITLRITYTLTFYLSSQYRDKSEKNVRT